jgi:hypothetical protein
MLRHTAQKVRCSRAAGAGANHHVSPLLVAIPQPLNRRRKQALLFPKTFLKPALGSIEKLRDTLQWNPEPGRPVVEFIPQLIHGLGDDVSI